jgi:hypothetical protein
VGSRLQAKPSLGTEHVDPCLSFFENENANAAARDPSSFSNASVACVFSMSYKTLFPEPISFHIHAKPPGCTVWCWVTSGPSPFWGFPPVFSATCRLLVSLCLLFTHAGLCFQRLAASFAKTPGVWGGQLRDDQRGRGRNGGRAVSGRGRMRKRGPSGGGTLRSDWPQQGQRPSSQNARVASARSQWPRASHCGLMHCTVKPGKNCISFPLGDQRTSWHRSSGAGPSSP